MSSFDRLRMLSLNGEERNHGELVEP